MSSPPDPPVLRRRVFYISGYDPFPPRRYRELYRKEAADQAQISGYEIAVSRSDTGPSGWQVRSTQDGHRTVTSVEVLVWSDIVRESFSATPGGTYLAMVRTARIYVFSGALRRLVRLRKGPVIAAFYPVVMLLFQAALALTAAVLVFRAGTGLMTGDRLVMLRTALVAGFGLTAALGVLRAFRAMDNRFFAHYLMHDFAYTASAGGAYPKPLSDRLDDFAQQIRDALREESDEVLVVGHSSGAFLAVTVLARLMRRAPPDPDGPVLSLLTLGQVVPMKSFLPGADDLRRDLRDMGAQQEIFWADVSAPGDGCSFALCDPVRVSGQAMQGTRWPLVLSAAFTQTLSPDRWRALRRRFFRLHFQYLCAFDRPGHYDYFRITAGPQTLRTRYGDRAPSPSVITTALSGHALATG